MVEKNIKVVFEEGGNKIIQVGKHNRLHEGEQWIDYIFVCLMRDAMGRKWASGRIYVPSELVDDPEFNHFELILELSQERKIQGIKHILDEN